MDTCRVKNRMTAKHDEGMSFAEFCYPVLQAWDWWHMYKTFDVQMQIGGSDQYGNILSGVDGIKYATKMDGVEPDALSAPLGFTVPLLTTSAGEKFGKSAGNAVWLDKEQTSVYDLYGVRLGRAWHSRHSLLTDRVVLRWTTRRRNREISQFLHLPSPVDHQGNDCFA